MNSSRELIGTAGAPPATAAEPSATEPGALPRVRVLLVEDDDSHAELIALRLERSVHGGFDVDRARDADEAASLAASSSAAAGYDALVIDYRLGDGDGLSLLARLREVGASAPAMLLTSQGSEEIAAASLRAGADDYLSKTDGLRGEALGAAVAAMVERRRLSRELDKARERAAKLDGALLVAHAVVHEINNAASPIVGFTELLALAPEVRQNPRLAVFVSRIADAGAQIAERVARLQQIVRVEEEPVAGGGPRMLDLTRSIDA